MIENSDFNTIGYGFLLVKMLVLSDMGPYQCFAENSLGKIQATAELAVYMRGKYFLSKFKKKIRLVMHENHPGYSSTSSCAIQKPYLSKGTFRFLAELFLAHFLSKFKKSIIILFQFSLKNFIKDHFFLYKSVFVILLTV